MMTIKAGARAQFHDAITEVLTPKSTNLVFAALLDTCLIHFDKLPLPVAREVSKTIDHITALIEAETEYLAPPMAEYGDPL